MHNRNWTADEDQALRAIIASHPTTPGKPGAGLLEAAMAACPDRSLAAVRVRLLRLRGKRVESGKPRAVVAHDPQVDEPQDPDQDPEVLEALEALERARARASARARLPELQAQAEKLLTDLAEVEREIQAIEDTLGRPSAQVATQAHQDAPGTSDSLTRTTCAPERVPAPTGLPDAVLAHVGDALVVVEGEAQEALGEPSPSADGAVVHCASLGVALDEAQRIVALAGARGMTGTIKVILGVDPLGQAIGQWTCNGPR